MGTLHIVATEKFTGNKKEIDVSELPKGIYFVEVVTDKESFYGKFVKE